MIKNGAGSDKQGELRNALSEMKLTCNTTFSIKKEDFLQCGSSVISPTIIYVTNELLHVLLMYSKQGNCMYYMYIQVGTKPLC